VGILTSGARSAPLAADVSSIDRFDEQAWQIGIVVAGKGQPVGRCALHHLQGRRRLLRLVLAHPAQVHSPA
jgi:hypothetical protein